MGDQPFAPDAHFIWFGRSFPWVHWLALASASRRSELSRIVVHHQDPVDSEWWPAALDLPRVEARRLDPEAVLEATGSQGGQLVDLYRLLRQPAARANVVRAALLHAHGGVYLDFDTVTVRPLAPLLEHAGAFCGVERLAFPRDPHRPHTVRRFVGAWARTSVRDVLRRVPEGWKWFRRLETYYPTAPNNAVIGCRPGNALLANLLTRMVALPASRRRVRYALGTHLLEEAVADYRGTDLIVHPPDVFYPLGPEISVHWFRHSRVPLAQLLYPTTRVVHWYASVRTRRIVPKIDPAWVREHHDRQPFSALALPFVELE